MSGNDNGHDYGTYSLTAVIGIGLPQIDQKTGQFSLTAMDVDAPGGARKRKRLADKFQPHGIPLVAVKRRKTNPPPPPAISAIGIMDIGQGGCAMLLDQNHEPVTYYDTGYPLFFYNSSTPVNVRAGAVNGGPIMQNTAGTLEVVLSHWDWDHWRLAAIWGLNGLPWTFPYQFAGPSAVNFVNTLANPTVYNPLVPSVVRANYTICKCTPPAGGAPSVLINNSGLALLVPMRFPTNDVNPHAVLMTGDANFDTLPNYPVGYPNLTGIAAVHHGSIANNAAANLPAQDLAYANQGRVAYSYGINAGGAHCYGFPVVAAVAAYQAAGWGQAAHTEMSTAEAGVLNGPFPPAHRGSILVGDQTQLPGHVIYTNTAFANFPSALV